MAIKNGSEILNSSIGLIVFERLNKSSDETRVNLLAGLNQYEFVEKRVYLYYQCLESFIKKNMSLKEAEEKALNVCLAGIEELVKANNSPIFPEGSPGGPERNDNKLPQIRTGQPGLESKIC